MHPFNNMPLAANVRKSFYVFMVTLQKCNIDTCSDIGSKANIRYETVLRLYSLMPQGLAWPPELIKATSVSGYDSTECATVCFRSIPKAATCSTPLRTNTGMAQSIQKKIPNCILLHYINITS